MAHFIPCTEASTAEDVAQLFLQHVWQLHGTPKCTVSDRGPQFNAKFLRALYKALQIEPTFSTAYHPQTDGHSEHLNQWLEGYLRAFINHRQTDWADWLALAEFAHNNAQSNATSSSPFQIVYGQSPVISLSLEPTGTPVANDRAQELAKVIAEVKATLQWTQECYKRADKGNSMPKFQAGDKVWLLGSHIKSQCPNKKLDHKQYGPFPVTEITGSHVYWLGLPETMKIHNVFHANLLTPVREDEEFQSSFTPPPPVITEEGEEQYLVDKLMDWKAEERIWKHRVRWEGYGPLDDTWEPASKLLHSEDQLQEFYTNYPNALKPEDPLPVAKAPVKRRGGQSKSLKSKTSFLSPSALSAQLLHSLLTQNYVLKPYSCNMSLGAQLTIAFINAANGTIVKYCTVHPLGPQFTKETQRLHTECYYHPDMGCLFWCDDIMVPPATLEGKIVWHWGSLFSQEH
jgi:hypothetical protein